MTVAAAIVVWLIWCVMAALSTSWIVLACLKAGGVIDWSWWVVLAPLFVSVALPSVSERLKGRRKHG